MPITEAAWAQVYVEPAPKPVPEPTTTIDWSSQTHDEHEEGSSTDVFRWFEDMMNEDAAASLAYAATAAVATSAFLLH